MNIDSNYVQHQPEACHSSDEQQLDSGNSAEILFALSVQEMEVDDEWSEEMKMLSDWMLQDIGYSGL